MSSDYIYFIFLFYLSPVPLTPTLVKKIEELSLDQDIVQNLKAKYAFFDVEILVFST
ncbi:MAG: hypothetical protein ACXAC7_23380 [Candidatus Hodarchaeales archaeon]|jgi:hypothetical protein